MLLQLNDRMVLLGENLWSFFFLSVNSSVNNKNKNNNFFI